MPGPLMVVKEVVKAIHPKTPLKREPKGKMPGGHEVMKFGDIEKLQGKIEGHKIESEKHQKRERMFNTAQTVVFAIFVALMAVAIALTMAHLGLPLVFTFIGAGAAVGIANLVLMDKKSRHTNALKQHKQHEAQLEDLRDQMQNEKFKAYVNEKNFKSMSIDNWLTIRDTYKKQEEINQTIAELQKG